MSEPKFQVGDLVAICSFAVASCTCGHYVIPSTTVTGFVYIAYPKCNCGMTYAAGWHYDVIEGGFFAEHTLRRIQPDEYTEHSEQEKELSQ